VRAHASTYERGIIPNLKGIAGTVEIRPVLERDVLPDDPGQYTPRILGAVPVATLSLRLSEGRPTAFVFQLDEKRLAELIGELQSLQKDVEAAKKALRLEK
jgi:hypothetical protein